MFAGNQEEEMKGKNEIKNKRTECWRNTREKIFYERRGRVAGYVTRKLHEVDNFESQGESVIESDCFCMKET